MLYYLFKSIAVLCMSGVSLVFENEWRLEKRTGLNAFGGLGSQ